LADDLAGWMAGPEHARLHIVLSWVFVLFSAAMIYALVRLALAPLQVSERLLRSTVQSIADPLLLLDLRGNVIDANRAAAEMFGVADAAQLRMHIHDLGDRYHLRYADGRPVPHARYSSDAALRGEVLRRYEALIRRADGTDLYITVSAAPVCEERGGPPQMAVTVLHDIHELKRLEKLRDEFLSVAAHELKTPVATVKGYAQLLQRPTFPAERADQALQVIARQCDRMDRMVCELLELSRLRVGRVRLNLQRIDLRRIAEDSVARMQVLARHHQLLLDFDGEATVEVDRDRLDQVLVNLLDNAVKFSPDGGQIRVRLRAEGDEVVLSVSDRGLGIPFERQSHIFERFYQAHAGELPNPGGMGVGLHLAREILDLHGGRIWFESQPGEGTTFFFALRRALADLSAPLRTHA
jgi:PAS domain S-box-containing protein